MGAFARSVRLAARRAEELDDPRLRPWVRPASLSLAWLAVRRHDVSCNICGWHGDDFKGVHHSESATCPRCGSIARDRFLYHCWVRREPYRAESRVLETSPRLAAAYKRRMAGLVDYVSSDYDERAHKADMHLDLQSLSLEDASVDVILTPHVLEHVPETDRALSEMYRVLKPGGLALVLVPVPQAQTARPTEPEYHGDDTLVHWRFGWDLTSRLRSHGFLTRILVTEDFLRRARTAATWDANPADVDANELIREAGPYIPDMLTVASDEEVAWLRLEPSYYFIAWEARKPEPGRRRDAAGADEHGARHQAAGP